MFLMKDKFEYKKDKYCLYAVMPEYVLPSGNVRVWGFGSQSVLFGDEMSRSDTSELEQCGPSEIELLKSELRKIGLDPD